MRITITKPQGKLKRELWILEFITDWHDTEIRLDFYARQYKENARQRNWRNNEYWDVMSSQRNTTKKPPTPLKEPPIPPDILIQAKQQIIKFINEIDHITIRH
jgi:hypothetical protein